MLILSPEVGSFWLTGPWNPSSWWVQQQQSIPPFTYTNPGACGYFSSPSVPGCSAASAPSSQRGIIQPPAKLSQKHQQLWEAQVRHISYSYRSCAI